MKKRLAWVVIPLFGLLLLSFFGIRFSTQTEAFDAVHLENLPPFSVIPANEAREDTIIIRLDDLHTETLPGNWEWIIGEQRLYLWGDGEIVYIFGPTKIDTLTLEPGDSIRRIEEQWGGSQFFVEYEEEAFGDFCFMTYHGDDLDPCQALSLNKHATGHWDPEEYGSAFILLDHEDLYRYVTSTSKMSYISPEEPDHQELLERSDVLFKQEPAGADSFQSIWIWLKTGGRILQALDDGYLLQKGDAVLRYYANDARMVQLIDLTTPITSSLGTTP